MESTTEVQLQICEILFEQTEDILMLCNLYNCPVAYNQAAKDLMGSMPDLLDLSLRPIDLDRSTTLNQSFTIKEFLNSPDQDNATGSVKTGTGPKPISLAKYSITGPDGKIQYQLLQMRFQVGNNVSPGEDSSLQQVLEDAQDAVIITDLTGKITSWNKGAESMLGYKKDEVIGKNGSLIIPADNRHEASSLLQKIKKGQRVSPYHAIWEKKSGKQLEVTVTMSPVRNETGQIIGASKIAYDITKDKKMEKALKIAYENRNELIAIASHEIKTPLAVLKGYLQLIYENVSCANKTFVAKALAQVKRLTSLINNLFQVSKLHTKKEPITFEMLNISALTAMLVEQFQVATPKREFKSLIEQDIYIEGNKLKLEQVISNLISNSVKYSSDDTSIELSLEKHQGKVRFTVKDKGIGIAPKDQKHIFSQYYRAGNIENNIPGLGLGLYISKTIVQQHHGKILVESNKGAGTVFKVILPLVQRKSKGKFH